MERGVGGPAAPEGVNCFCGDAAAQEAAGGIIGGELQCAEG